VLTKINDSIKQGMLQGKTEYVNVLRLVKAELLNHSKSHDAVKDDIAVVKSYVKKLTKALDAYANRPEELERLKREISIVNEFLPTPVSAQQIFDHVSVTVQNLLSAVGARPNPGFVIKAVKAQLPDADGGLVAQITNDVLKGIQ
jgi:uncharacterized protein YqeY